MVGVKSIKDLLSNKARLHDSYQSVFDTPSGEVVLHHLMKLFHVTTPTFTHGDSHASAFKEGQRHVVLSILRYVNKDHDQILKQINQYNVDE